jgi:putrescine aminotransferase
MLSRADCASIYEKSFNFGLGRLFRVAGVPIETSARGSWAVDETGRRYLDFGTSFGVFSVGHCNARVQSAVLAQLDRMASAPWGLAGAAEEELRRRLREVLPGDLNEVVFSGSGSEAAEAALRIVSLANAGRTRLVATSKGYHGKTLGALGVIGQPHLREPFEPLWREVSFVETGDEAAIVGAIDGRTAAVFVEPVTAGNYLIVPRPGYLAAVRRACDKHGALMVVDEVQTAFGRTGWLFGSDRDDVVPDIMMMSKVLTGGCIAFAATAMRDDVARKAQLRCHDLRQALQSPSAGWPIACAAALAAIDEVLGGRLPERAARLGQRLLSGLKDLAERHPRLIVSAEGIGLMTGLISRNRAVEYAIYLKMLRRGVISGLSLNSTAPTPVLRLYPPLTVSEQEIERALRELAGALEEIERLPSFVLEGIHHSSPLLTYLPARLARLSTRIIA